MDPFEHSYAMGSFFIEMGMDAVFYSREERQENDARNLNRTDAMF